MKLKACLIAICTIVLISANAQFRGGLQANALKLPKSAGNYGMNFGPGIDFSWSPDDSKAEFFFNGGYFLPATSNGTSYGFEGNQNVAMTQKTSFIALGLGGRYFFMDREESDFNVYGTGSANLLLGNTTASYSNAPNGFYPGSGDAGKTHQTMISLGLGFEYKVGETGAIFAEAQYRFPTGSYNSRTGYEGDNGDLEIPGHLWFSAGYKFSFGGGGSGY